MTAALAWHWRQPMPAYSPLTGGAILAGVRAAAGITAPGIAEEHLVSLLEDRYAPRGMLFTDSGTSALGAALIGVLLSRPRSTVAVPAFACYDVATALNAAGANVLLYDIDPRTLAPDLDSLRGAMRGDVAAVVLVTLYGHPVDAAPVLDLAKEHGAIVIEDAAQAAGAVFLARPVGSHGSLGVLSYGRGKGLTGGGGGALLANNAAGERVLAHARTLCGRSRRGWKELLAATAQWVLARPDLYSLADALPFLKLGETVYHAPRPPHAMPHACAAVAVASWGLAERELQRRRENAIRLLTVVGARPQLTPMQVPLSGRPGHLRLPLLASPEVRARAVSRAARRLGIMPSYPRSLADLAPLADRVLNGGARFPGARALAAQLVTLPTHGRLRDDDLLRLEDWIRESGAR